MKCRNCAIFKDETGNEARTVDRFISVAKDDTGNTFDTDNFNEKDGLPVSTDAVLAYNLIVRYIETKKAE